MQRRVPLLRDLDTQDAREDARQAGHAALEPVAAVGGDDVRHLLHKAGSVGADQRQHQMRHAILEAVD